MESNQNLCRWEGKKWALSPVSWKPISFSQSTPPGEQYRVKAFIISLCHCTSWIVWCRQFWGWWFRGWRNPFQLTHAESILSMENRKLWGITADSSSDLFCRSWVMSTLKPPAGRKWGSPLGSYHSSFPPGNRRVPVCLTWEHWE